MSRQMAFGAMALCMLTAGAPAMAAPARETVRADGSVISWSLDRRGGAGPQGILLLAQGSGCASVSENPNVERAKALLPAFAVVTVEKYGVKPHDAPADPTGDCSASFYQHHTVSQRAADYEQVLAIARQERWWNGELILFGGSEGGAAIAMAAARVKPTAVVVLSTALGQTFRESFALSVPPEVAAMAEVEFAKIKAEPDSSKQWGGNSYRWWADVLDHDYLADLLTVEAPILLVQGETDQSGAAKVARAAYERYRQARRCNLTYWEFAGYDHQMLDAAGTSHIDEVMGRASGWLGRQLIKPDQVGC